MKKKILVTGADGFIGSHLVERLLKKDITLKQQVIIMHLIHMDG